MVPSPGHRFCSTLGKSGHFAPHGCRIHNRRHTCARVASVLHGVAGTDWELLKQRGNCCHLLQHEADPWAWPRDGNRETLEGAGVALATQYREQGLNMLHEFAHYLEASGQKSVSVEAGLMDVGPDAEREFKVFREHRDWSEEFRLYHRRDGKVVKEGDDLMCAMRYALMSLRLANTATAYRSFRRKLVYPKSSVA